MGFRRRGQPLADAKRPPCRPMGRWTRDRAHRDRDQREDRTSIRGLDGGQVG
jgi:hypothetical protein